MRPSGAALEGYPPTSADLGRLSEESWITPDLAERAAIRRFDEQTARDHLGKAGTGRFEGLAFPYIPPGQERPVEYRVRRDSPELERQADGSFKPRGKYCWPPGRRNRAYFVPGEDTAALGDKMLPIVIAEGEKKTLALERLAWHECSRRRWMPLGIPGVWSFRCTRAKRPGPNGQRLDEKGALPEFDGIEWKGRCVFVVFDSDVHSNENVSRARDALALELRRRGALVKLVDLPRSDQKLGVDALLANKGPEFVLQLFDAARDAKPEINASDQDLERSSGQAWNALELANTPTRMFRYAGGIVSVEDGSDGCRLVRLDKPRLTHHLARAARWWKPGRGDNERKSARPPGPVVEDMLAHPSPPLSELKHVVRHPVLTLHGIVKAIGFDESTGIYLDWKQPDVVQRSLSTGGDVSSAIAVLKEPLIDFPFVGEADLAHALAAMLLPFVRPAIDGPTPLFLISKPSPGTGGGLLTETLAYPAFGRMPALMVPCGSEDEWRKQITSALLNSPEFVVIDNLRGLLESSVLASAITSCAWSDRLLGGNDRVELPIRCTWIANGNNPRLSSELSRRAVDIRLDARMERPDMRDFWRIPDLRGWLKLNRDRLVEAALAVVTAWAEAGRPHFQGRTLGSFEQWASITGGILGVAGVEGFLANGRPHYHDEESKNLRAMVLAWWGKYGQERVAPSQLVSLASEAGLNLGNRELRGLETKLGLILGSVRDATFQISDGLSVALRICSGPERGRRYGLQPTNPTDKQSRIAGTS